MTQRSALLVGHVEHEIRQAFAHARAMDWRSHDPFDLLLSPYLGGVRLRSTPGARLAVQVGRRTGIRLRRILGVPEHEEPKALADFLRAAVLLARGGADWCGASIGALATRVAATGTNVDGGHGWGISFPYVSRFVNVAAGEPNAYITICVAQALLDAAEVTQDDAVAVNAVRAACRFLVDGLGSFTAGGRRWLRYWPGLDNPIVNIQASAASLLARAAMRLGDASLRRPADDAAATALATQRTDGSWPYSVDGRANFVDGFHTGFVLQGLAEYVLHRPAAAERVRAAVDLGMRHFRAHLMAPDGLPRGFANGAVSLDAQNVAQCIQTLLIAGGREEDVVSAARLWAAARDQGRSPLLPRKGYLALRWSVGPGVLAGAHLVRIAGNRGPCRPAALER